MADEFDGCECVWSHEYAMQRLLAFIRQNQNDCSDTHCIDVAGNLQQSTLPSIMPSNSDTGSDYTMMVMLMMFALIMYMIRPQSLLSLNNTKQRRDRDSNGNGQGGASSSSHPPPPAPPAVN